MTLLRWGLAPLLLGGCVSVPLPHYPADHPANPAAAAAPAAPVAPALDGFRLPGAVPSTAVPSAPTPTEDPHAGHR